MEHIIDRNREPQEYKKLQIVAEYLNSNAIQNDTKTNFYVGETYLDFGQNWKWTTILADNPKKGSSWQVLYPREWKEIYLAEPSELYEIAEQIINGKYFIA